MILHITGRREESPTELIIFNSECVRNDGKGWVNNMCLYPKKHINKKYTITEKNGGNIPELPVTGTDEYGYKIYDERVTEIEIPCGRCIECCKQKAREWQVRLGEEIKDWSHMYFVTFTFSPEGLQEILFKHKIQECNAAAAYALRKSLELYRKYNKKSYRHWFITELGHEGTERIHMHGIIFFNNPQEFEKIEEIKGKGWMCKWKYWKYGHIFVGNYVNQRSVNYVVKYMNKIDSDHKTFIGQILASPGIGRRYIDRMTDRSAFAYRPRQTRDWYTLNNGSKVKMPTYYANKLWNEEERELKWREFLDTEKISIKGNTYHYRTTKGAEIANIVAKAQEVNEHLDYGTDSKEWRKQPHNITKNMLQKAERRKLAEQARKKLGMPLLGNV